MKNNIIKFFALVFLFQVTGCTSDFDETNTNPNTLTSDQLDATMAGPAFANALYKGTGNASWSLPDDDYGTYGLATALHSMLFTHYMYTGGAVTDANGLNDGWRGRGWLRFYTLAVPSLLNSYKGAKGNAEATAILDIWKVYMFHRFTDEWGPVPYSQAGLGGSSVAYDSQEAMYTDFFKLLEAANTTLSTTSQTTVGIFKDYDAIYGGNIEKWRKFGNSLRLRLALRISDRDAAKAKTQAEAAVAAGVMLSNNDSAYYKVTKDTYNNFVDIMKYWGYFMTADMESILKGYNDPRMSIWFAPVSDATSVYKDQYVGMPNGISPTVTYQDKDFSGTNQTTTFSDNATKNIEVMMASESNFNRSEGTLLGWNMSGTAKTLYEDGIRLSLQQWGVTDNTAINAYIAGTTTGAVPTFGSMYSDPTPPVNVPVAWAGTVSDQKKQIAVQKYLGLFPESWEAWSDLRRTDAPILYPLLTTLDATIGKGIMKRLTYLPNEYSTNGDAVNSAVTALGGPDKGSTLLWWDVK